MKKKVKEPEGMKMLKEAFKVFDDTGKGSLTRLNKMFQCKRNSNKWPIKMWLITACIAAAAVPLIESRKQHT